MFSLFQTVAELGVVIFTALDFGLKEDEERQLSPALENVIDLMTSAGEKRTAGLKQIHWLKRTILGHKTNCSRGWSIVSFCIFDIFKGTIESEIHGQKKIKDFE